MGRRCSHRRRARTAAGGRGDGGAPPGSDSGWTYIHVEGRHACITDLAGNRPLMAGHRLHGREARYLWRGPNPEQGPHALRPCSALTARVPATGLDPSRPSRVRRDRASSSSRTSPSPSVGFALPQNKPGPADFGAKSSLDNHSATADTLLHSRRLSPPVYLPARADIARAGVNPPNARRRTGTFGSVFR